MKNKIMMAFLTFILGQIALAGVCADSYTEFVKNSDVFTISDSGELEVIDSQRLIINEKRGKTQKLVITDQGKKIRTSFVIEKSKGAIVSISKSSHGKSETQKFDPGCAITQEMMDENTRTKIDAVEADHSAK